MNKFKNTVVVGGIVSALLGGVLLPADASAAAKTSVVKANDFTQQRAELGRVLTGMDKKLESLEKGTFITMVDRVSKLHAVKGSELDGTLRKLRVEGGTLGSDVDALRGQVAFLKIDAMNAKDTDAFARVRVAITSMDKKIRQSETAYKTFTDRVLDTGVLVKVQNVGQLKKFDSSTRGAFESRSVRNINYTDLLTNLESVYNKKKMTNVRKAALLKSAEDELIQSNRAHVAEGLAAMENAYVKIYTGDFTGAYKELNAYAKTTRMELLAKYAEVQVAIHTKYMNR